MNVTAFEDAFLQSLRATSKTEVMTPLAAKALRYVMQNAFINITNTIVMTISSSELSVHFTLCDIIKNLFTTWSFIAVQLVVVNTQRKHLNVLAKRYCNIILIDSLKSLEQTHMAEHNRLNDKLEYYFIFLQITDDRLESEMKKIFQYCFDNYWLHCNVMIQDSQGEIYIYTYFPFQDEQCFQTKPVLINHFVGDRFVNAVMFPNKLKNLHLCPLKVSTWEVPPFVINQTNFRLPKRQMSGYEMLAIDSISQHMNFTLDIELTDIKYDNDQTAKPLAYLRERKTNISMGYFRRTMIDDEFITTSDATYFLRLVALVIETEEQYDAIDILKYPFDKVTWSLLGVSCGILALINAFQRSASKENYFQILETVIGVSTNSVPSGMARRICFVLWLLSTFLLRSIYQSLLFYVYSTHFYKVLPVSLNILAAAGFKTISTEFSRNIVVNVAQIANGRLPLITLNNSDEMEPIRYLKNNPEENVIALTTMDFVFVYLSNEMEEGKGVQALKLKVYPETGFHFTKHSYLIDSFNDYISRFHQAGLLNNWKHWTIYDYKVSEKANKAGVESDLIFSLNQLIGFFYFILFVHLTSFVVFLLELLSVNIVWLRRYL